MCGIDRISPGLRGHAASQRKGPTHILLITRSRAQLACGPKKLPLVEWKGPLALWHLIMTMSVAKANNVIIALYNGNAVLFV
jgi:hypothetical protein